MTVGFPPSQPNHYTDAAAVIRYRQVPQKASA